MNAQEARALTTQNSYRVADELLNEVIKQVNDLIKTAAGEGKASIRFEIMLSKTVIDYSLAERLRNHLIENSFKVKILDRFLAIQLVISW